MHQGVRLLDPARFDLRGELVCGSDVQIDVNCVFEGRVKIGNHVHIGPNCVIRDVAIGDDSRIEAFSHLDSADIGRNCRIGPYARLRPGAALAEDVHIGNFVELKKTVLGEGSKVNHLSYIGDAEVGSGVNIGAGTITCNYDGYFKYKTVIGERAFIGGAGLVVYHAHQLPPIDQLAVPKRPPNIAILGDDGVLLLGREDGLEPELVDPLLAFGL